MAVKRKKKNETLAEADEPLLSESTGLLVTLGFGVATFTPASYLRHRL